VTGAATGIGRATAVELARLGFDIALHTRSNEAALAEAAKLVQAMGRKTMTVMADLSDSIARGSLVERCWQWRDRVDVWVNNAGGDVLTGVAAEWSLEQKMDYLLEVDVKGTFFLSREIGRRMVEASRGVIVNIGWDQAMQGMAGDSGELFATTKGAVMAFTRSLAQSLAPHVRVNCVAPGWIKTAWGDEASEYWQERAVKEALVGRWGTPENVAAAIGFLSSAEAEFITGHTLPVNGGFRYGVPE